MNHQNVDGKNNHESSDLTFFMEQEEDLYATLDDRDSITSENINSFNKNVYIRNDEVNFLNTAIWHVNLRILAPNSGCFTLIILKDSIGSKDIAKTKFHKN